MSGFTELMEHPGRAMRRASHEVTDRPKSIVGIILLAIGLYTIYRMWPEVQRYLKIERM